MSNSVCMKCGHGMRSSTAGWHCIYPQCSEFGKIQWLMPVQAAPQPTPTPEREALKPCPFCAVTCEYETEDDENSAGVYITAAHLDWCPFATSEQTGAMNGLSFDFNTDAELESFLAAWNHRAPPPTSVKPNWPIYAWLGLWRNKMPNEAVSSLQDILGPLGFEGQTPPPSPEGEAASLSGSIKCYPGGPIQAANGDISGVTQASHLLNQSAIDEAFAPAAPEATDTVTPEWEAILCLRSALYHLHKAIAPTGRDEEIVSELQGCWKHLAKRSTVLALHSPQAADETGGAK